GLDMIADHSPELEGRLIAELLKTPRRCSDIKLLEKHLQNTEARTKETDTGIRQRLAEEKLQVGDTEGARDALRPLAPDLTPAKIIGEFYFEDKDYRQAREWLLKDTSDSYQVKRMLAECAVALGDLDKAVTFFREAMTL